MVLGGQCAKHTEVLVRYRPVTLVFSVRDVLGRSPVPWRAPITNGFLKMKV